MQYLTNPNKALQEQMLQKMQNMNPTLFSNIQNMINGKSDAELKQMAMNLAKERGIPINDILKNLGVKY
jgi:hypothetical protein